MGDRDAVLGALPEPSGGSLPASFDRRRANPKDLWLEFEERLVALGGQMLPLATLPLVLARDGGYWADDDAQALLPRSGKRADSVWTAEVGVCIADMAIAETGTLLLSSASGRGRLTSLAPPVNLILAYEDAIVGYPEEVLSHLPASTSVLVSGTSRTADIEGVLVRGVHGPREIYVIKLDRK